MLKKITDIVIAYITKKLNKKAAANSVANIVADFNEKVTALHNLVDAKHEVMSENSKTIAVLRDESKKADEEAAKATEIARTIASLIE